MNSVTTQDTLPTFNFEWKTKGREVDGFSGLGDMVFQRTYARYIPDKGRKETWEECCYRVCCGTFSILKCFFKKNGMEWEEKVWQKKAMKMMDMMTQMKFLPPGRGLRQMGTAVTSKGIFVALNNCAFISTADLDQKDPAYSFRFMMDALMCGVGVGTDCLGADKGLKILTEEESKKKGEMKFVVKDTRLGWVQALSTLINSFFLKTVKKPVFDFSKIRKKGVPLKTFGGISSGPQPLIDLLHSVEETLTKEKGMTLRAIIDIANLIGKCVVSGNIRRSAEICFAPSSNKEFLSLKDYKKHPDRMAFGWASNNSVFCSLGQDYSDLTDNIAICGEPGVCWLENMRTRGRMCDPPTDRDSRVSGGNPCLEQSLESEELCCLVETFPTKCTRKEWPEVLEMALLYAKIVTLCATGWPKTDEIMSRNRRIGCSMTGITQFISKRGLHELKEWCQEGYKTLKEEDKRLSNMMKVPMSVKLTSVKPSGTVSLLAGVTPGIHYPIGRTYIRRVRISKSDPLLQKLKHAGLHIEDCIGMEKSTAVVSFPIDCGSGMRAQEDVSMMEQLMLAAFMQEHWADNQVSATITFKKEEASQIPFALDFFQYKLKGVSFLPHIDCGYEQLPYEKISLQKYKEMSKNVKKINLSDVQTEQVEEKFCDSESCDIKSWRKKKKNKQQ